MNKEFIKNLDDNSLWDFKRATEEDLKIINEEIENRESLEYQIMQKLGKGN